VSFQKNSVKEGNHCPRTSQQSDLGLLTRVGIDYYPLHPKYRPFLLSKWISATLSFKNSVGDDMTMSAGEGQAEDDPAHPGSRRTRTRSGAATGSARMTARW
jgi:hypothetical protein